LDDVTVNCALRALPRLHEVPMLDRVGVDAIDMPPQAGLTGDQAHLVAPLPHSLLSWCCFEARI